MKVRKAAATPKADHFIVRSKTKALGDWHIVTPNPMAEADAKKSLKAHVAAEPYSAFRLARFA